MVLGGWGGEGSGIEGILGGILRARGEERRDEQGRTEERRTPRT